jgi:hypothetical protein
MPLLGFAAMSHSYYYIPFFVPFIHISVSLDDLFQRIAAIYDRSKMALFNYLFHSDKVFGARPRHAAVHRGVLSALRQCVLAL